MTVSAATAPPPASVRPGTLELRHVGKTYRGPERTLEVLAGITLTIAPGEIVSFVGASGCGKSTLLRLIAGLDGDFEGEVRLDGSPVRGPGPGRGVVFQDHRLLPWLTVERNVELGLINAPLPPETRNQAAREHLALVGLAGFETVFPYQLSGGMAQRAAIARALVSQPDVLLLDEPFGALDALTRIRLQEELHRIIAQEGITTLLVTHDVEEAAFLSDRVVVLDPRPGRVRAVVPIEPPRPRDRAGHALADARREILAAMAR